MANKTSVPQLAQVVALNQQTMYDYLAGRNEMLAGNIEQVLTTLGVRLR